MAVYEQTYRPYTGPLTAERGRFLVIPRYNLRETFGSKLFLAFFVICFVPPLVASAFVWVLHNATFLEFAKLIFGGQAPDLEIGSSFFFFLTIFQGSFALLLTILAAPPLVAADLNNNALPLYLSRPFSRSEYVAGKASVLLLLLSAVTWAPLLWVFSLQAALADGWLRDNVGLGVAVLLGSSVWILVLAFAGLAVSATVKWKPVARLVLFALFLFSWVVAKFVNGLFNRSFDRPWGDVLSPIASVRTVWHRLFDVPAGAQIPQWAAWGCLLAVMALCLLLLARRVRAYEVVS